jgi:hypothetical protein
MSTLFVNNLNTVTGTTITVPTGKRLVGTDAGGITSPGMVIQVVRHTIPDQSISAGSSNISFGNYSITKHHASSNILILVNIEYSNTPTSDGASGDDNSSMKLRNTTDGVYIKNRAVYNESDGFFATDTSHYYSGISGLTAGEFAHHTYHTTASLLDTTNTAGQITYQLQASAQNSAFRMGRFGDCSLTMMEIGQ